MDETKPVTAAQKSRFLYTALKESQDNIRTYDTKAQIVGIGFIFTVGMLIKFNTWTAVSQDIMHLATMVSWFLIIVPVVFFGFVLYPTRRVAPKVLKNQDLVKGLFYLYPDQCVTTFTQSLNDMDIEQELSYELLKVSYLRDLKRRRFLLAMTMASISLFLLFVMQMIPTLKLLG